MMCYFALVGLAQLEPQQILLLLFKVLIHVCVPRSGRFPMGISAHVFLVCTSQAPVFMPPNGIPGEGLLQMFILSVKTYF